MQIEKAKMILEKVRFIAKYNLDMKPFMEARPEIIFKEKDGDIVFSHITFNTDDTLMVCDTGIIIYPQKGMSKTLFAYNSFDELLYM
ncbi:MAG: hypothetical protein IJ433_01550 [Ruminococcus sp.]|nr:hypothetical protein [Ruminococcus sp.]